MQSYDDMKMVSILGKSKIGKTTLFNKIWEKDIKFESDTVGIKVKEMPI